MNQQRSDDSEDVRLLLQSIRARLRRLTVAVVLMALVVFVLAAVIYGYLADFHASEGLLIGGVSLGAALAGFGFGWFAGRRC